MELNIYPASALLKNRHAQYNIILAAGVLATYLPISNKLYLYTLLPLYLLLIAITSKTIKHNLVHYFNVVYLACICAFDLLQILSIYLFYLENLLITISTAFIFFIMKEGDGHKFYKLMIPNRFPYIFVLYSIISVLGICILPMQREELSRDFVGDMSLINALPYYKIILICIVISFINAIIEETQYRHCYFTALERISYLRFILPSLAFSLVHYKYGFPNGIIGVFLTFIFGLMLTDLRIKSGSILLGIIIHFLCDIIIVARIFLF